MKCNYFCFCEDKKVLKMEKVSYKVFVCSRLNLYHLETFESVRRNRKLEKCQCKLCSLLTVESLLGRAPLHSALSIITLHRHDPIVKSCLTNGASSSAPIVFD